MKSNVKIFLAVALAFSLVFCFVSVFADNEIEYTQEQIMTLTVKYGGRELANNDMITLDGPNVSRTLVINSNAKYVDSSLVIYCASAENYIFPIAQGEASVEYLIPDNLAKGYDYYFDFQAVSNNNANNYVGISNIVRIKVEVPDTKIRVDLKDGNEYIAKDSQIARVPGHMLTLAGSSEGVNVNTIRYSWDDSTDYQYGVGTSVDFLVPDFPVGTIHVLHASALGDDGTWSAEKLYYVLIGEQYVNPTPIVTPFVTPTLIPTPVDPIYDVLIVEDWMKENDDLDELAVSLRHYSNMYEKKNKNMYALNEEIVYCVDYKNGGRDITKDVELVLDLPLDFLILDSYGGEVDLVKKTINWHFPGGLKKGACGTKVVRIAYTAFSRSTRKSETIYPSAKIYQGSSSKPSDVSTVINLIYKDSLTELADEHYPYMLGDKNATTFRPDDGISRAEGAIVLARIFGINFTGTIVNGDEYVDLGETYIEAQQAIVASTKLGLIVGYGDGTYRPNQKITNAEFMKIIASYIEVRAKEDGIDGLNIKDIDGLIKVYKDPTNIYMVGDTTTNIHWALKYITLLIRLNMTPVSSSQMDLKLDEPITRAETAQLMNYFLFRAPTEVGVNKFSDVSRSHKLYTDILEATRDTHTYVITSDGMEDKK